MALRRPRDHSGAGSLVSAYGQMDEVMIQVKVKDMAAYVPPLLHEQPFGAKVDVEGSEPYLLPWLAKAPAVRFIVFESDHLSTVEPVWNALRANRLLCYGISKTLFRVRLARLDRAADLRRFIDVVAFKAPRNGGVPRAIGLRTLRALGCVKPEPAKGRAAGADAQRRGGPYCLFGFCRGRNPQMGRRRA